VDERQQPPDQFKLSAEKVDRQLLNHAGGQNHGHARVCSVRHHAQLERNTCRFNVRQQHSLEFNSVSRCELLTESQLLIAAEVLNVQ
jgi:hypothetical protein